MKKTCAAFLCGTQALFSLPSDPSVIEGAAQVHKKEKTMVIHTSDKAILNYSQFDINNQEKVQFIQPSNSSCVLNRVEGKNPSKILGTLEGNGKIFLVNPNGMFFGKNSVVNAASFIASTLDICNENFLEENYRFSLTDKNKISSIHNEGFLSASNVVLMAPIISNLGTIHAEAGKVVLASAEHITLKFSGNNLLSFSVDGEIKDALIEHLGNIQAGTGSVSIQLPIAKKAIKDLVNRDGIEQGVVFVEENGKILLTAKSSIQGQNLSLQGGSLEIQGTIDASSNGLGGEITLTGKDISIQGAHLNASGKLGGGTILVGGDLQGKGDLPYAANVSTDAHSSFLAGAVDQGDGGKIILWSSKRTSFAGKAFATGGKLGGNGGVVETSSLGDLFIQDSFVDTTAKLGIIGNWLLDPSLLRITAVGGAIPSGCSSSGDIAVAILESQASTVTLCADSIIQEVPISMSVAGAGLIFTAPADSEGVLSLQENITTKGGVIEIHNLETVVSNSITLDTTGSGSSGASILIGSMNTNSNIESLSILAGSGNVTLDRLGVLNPFGAISVSADQIHVNTLFTSSSPITFSGSVLMFDEGIISSAATGSGADITAGTINGTITGINPLTLNAGTNGSITLGNVGSSTPLHSFIITNAASSSLKDITVEIGPITIHSPVILTEPVTRLNIFSRASSSLEVESIDGTSSYGQSLEISTNSKGRIVLGNIGETTPLNDVTIGENKGVSLQHLFATSLTELVSSGDTVLSGNISVTNFVNLTSGPLVLEGSIEANHLSIIAYGAILKNSSSQNILVTGTVDTVLNSIGSDVGRRDSPISLTVQNNLSSIVLGAKNIASLSGPLHQIRQIALDVNNPPCFVFYNDRLLMDCNQTFRNLFQDIRKSIFKFSYFNNTRLGIGRNILLGLGPYFLYSYFTEDFSQKIDVPKKPEPIECNPKSCPCPVEVDSNCFSLPACNLDFSE